MFTQQLVSIALTGSEWVIYLLLFLSICSIAIIIDRLYVFSARASKKETLRDNLRKAFQDGDYEKFLNVLNKDYSSSATVAKTAITNIETKYSTIEEAILNALSQEKLLLEKRIIFLGTLGSNAPFLGLFGTVLGIVSAFHHLAQNTKIGTAGLMAGISEALVATALGLFVAIPAVVAYNYFVRRIKKTMIYCEDIVRLVIAYYLRLQKAKDKEYKKAAL